MNYKVLMYRDRKLCAIQEVKTAKSALFWYNIWISHLTVDGFKSWYWINHDEYIIILYYKNKRIKTKKLTNNA